MDDKRSYVQFSGAGAWHAMVAPSHLPLRDSTVTECAIYDFGRAHRYSHDRPGEGEMCEDCAVRMAVRRLKVRPGGTGQATGGQP